jgi:hypothetical protein
MYTDSELLPLSALRHLIFCERQCAFIHAEQCNRCRGWEFYPMHILR